MKKNHQHATKLVEDYINECKKIGRLQEIPNWPIEAWLLLCNIQTEDLSTSEIQHWIAHQQHAPEEVVRLLVKSDSWRVRSRIAEKRNLPGDLFITMSEDGDEAVRGSIAQNKKTPISIVQTLINDPTETVRRVAKYRLSQDIEPNQISEKSNPKKRM